MQALEDGVSPLICYAQGLVLDMPIPAYVSIRQHTSAYVSIRQHTSAYVSIRQRTSAYVSIRQLDMPIPANHARYHQQLPKPLCLSLYAAAQTSTPKPIPANHAGYD